MTSDTTALSHDPISARDWEILEGLSVILQPVYRLTKDLQLGQALWGMYGTLAEVLPSLDGLHSRTNCNITLRQLMALRIRRSADFSLAINKGLHKLDVYHKKLRSTPAYIAALALDPRLKCRYLEENRVGNWLA